MRRTLRKLAPVGAGLLLVACGYSDPYQGAGPAAGVRETTPTPAPGQDDFSTGANLKMVKLPDGLQFADVKVGDGPLVKKNDKLEVQYTGWLASGKKFDSSRDRGQPFSVTIGQGQVIPGWDEGIPGMRVGGVRRLVVPPDLGYGSQGQPQGGIPANATLVFLVEVVKDDGPAPTPSPGSTPTTP